MTHGWPGSIVEFLEVIGPLTDPPPTAATPPTRSTSSARRCRATASATSRPRRAGASSGSPRAWGALMARLGYERYGAQGGDWGTSVTA